MVSPGLQVGPVADRGSGGCCTNGPDRRVGGGGPWRSRDVGMGSLSQHIQFMDGGFKYVLFHPETSEDEPISTNILCRRVGSTTNLDFMDGTFLSFFWFKRSETLSVYITFFSEYFQAVHATLMFCQAG